MERKDIMRALLLIFIAMVIPLAILAPQDPEFVMVVCGTAAFPLGLLVWYIGLKG